MEISLGRNVKPVMRQLAGASSQPVVRNIILPGLSALLVLGVWEAATRWGGFQPFILPAPEQVAQRFAKVLADGSLFGHAATTLLEVLLGLLMGVSLATVSGYLIGKSHLLEKLVSPYMVASQAIPVVAIAPLLVIWFGPGIFSKILICSLTVFFPVLVNTVVGVRAVPDNLRDLMRSMQATPLQTLLHLEIPAALPVFLGGLRVGATLSVIGGVVGELVGANSGLGFLISVGRNQYDTPLVFVAVFTLIIMALGLYGLVLLAEKRLLAWQSH